MFLIITVLNQIQNQVPTTSSAQLSLFLIHPIFSPLKHVSPSKKKKNTTISPVFRIHKKTQISIFFFNLPGANGYQRADVYHLK